MRSLQIGRQQLEKEIICQKRRFNTLAVWKLLTNYEWMGCLITSGCWLSNVTEKALQHSGCQQFGSCTEVSTTFLLQAAMNRLEMCEKWWSEKRIYKSYTSWHYLLQVNNALRISPVITHFVSSISMHVYATLQLPHSPIGLVSFPSHSKSQF